MAPQPQARGTRTACLTGAVSLQHGHCSPGPRLELEKQLAVMSSRFCQRVLVDLFVWNDDQNSSRHIIYV